MWISLNDGFVSVVKDRLDPKGRTLLVRARKREHLAAFFGKRLKGVTIYEDEAADYRWRAKAPRAKVAAVMASRIETLSYDNFKNSVKDDELHSMYSRWWSDHWRLQERAHPPLPPVRRQRALWPPSKDDKSDGALAYQNWLKEKDLFK